MAFAADEALEQFLTKCGLTWSVIPPERHFSLGNDWNALYANVSHWLRQTQGTKAQFEYSKQSAETFMIVPFHGSVAGPLSNIKRCMRKAAYECRGDGALPDLSGFADMEFFIVPVDLSWTMIHTHEDYGHGGPYFVRKDWLGLPRI